MMGSFLQNVWARLLGSLGQVGPLLSIVVGELYAAIKTSDIDKILSACDKLDIVALDITKATANLRQHVEDGILTVAEGAESLIDLEQLIADAAKLAKK
jgi:hypothetical protein